MLALPQQGGGSRINQWKHRDGALGEVKVSGLLGESGRADRMEWGHGCLLPAEIQEQVMEGDRKDRLGDGQ